MASMGATAAVILASGAVAGCGGGGSSETRDDTRSAHAAAVVSQPTARRPIATQIGPFSDAVSSQSCRAYQPLRFSAIRQRPPGSPATAAECRRGDPGLAGLKGASVDRAGQFKTGAVMEGTGRGGARTWTMWVLDGDRRFRYTGVSGASAQVGTPFAKRTEAQTVAAAFVRSVRRRDCPAMQRLFSPAGSRLVESLGGTRAACQAVLKGRLLAPALRETPRLRPELLGGTKDLAFVGLPARHTYFTLMLGDLASPTLRVVDVLPSTPVDLPG